MDTDRDPMKQDEATKRYAPSPTLFWLPGTLMLWFGVWGVADAGIGWAWGVWPLGLALVIVGSVAQGVAWGMDVHKDRHP